MPGLLPSEVEDLLSGLAAVQQRDAVLDEMETRAREHGFPIIGRAAGRYVELQARAIGARRVVELGSGYGYSAYWFARAVGEDGEVVCTDGDPANAELAQGYLRRANLWDRVDYHVGDALGTLAQLEGPIDLVYCDIDKDGYPAAWEAASDRLEVGGAFVCDNVLWGGRVAGLGEPNPARDAVTDDIVAMTRAVANDDRFVSSIVPIRDGLLVALRVS